MGESYHSRVCVVVLNYNGMAINKRCLDSLLAQHHKNTDILFVDNGSIDGSFEAVQQMYGERLTYIDNGENLYFAGGNNRGIRHALEVGADYVFILNNDTEVAPDCITNLVSFMNETPDAAGCQPLLLSMDEKGTWGNVASAGGAISLSGRCWDLDAGKPERGDCEHIEIPCATGGAFFLRATILKDFHGFDEDYIMYFEDVDLSFRIRGRGGNLYLVPTARIGHMLGATTSREAPLLRIRLTERNSYRLIATHFPRKLKLKALLVCLFFSVGSALLALLRGKPATLAAIVAGSLQGIGFVLGKTPAMLLEQKPAVDLTRYIAADVWFPPQAN